MTKCCLVVIFSSANKRTLFNPRQVLELEERFKDMDTGYLTISVKGDRNLLISTLGFMMSEKGVQI